MRKMKLIMISGIEFWNDENRVKCNIKLNFVAHSSNTINSITTQNVLNAVLSLPQTLNNLQSLQEITKSLSGGQEKTDDLGLSAVLSETPSKAGKCPFLWSHEFIFQSRWFTPRIGAQVRVGQAERANGWTTQLWDRLANVIPFGQVVDLDTQLINKIQFVPKMDQKLLLGA